MEQNDRQTVLIVDDEPGNIRILVELLRSDYRTLVATNGDKALQIARAENPPDLILLDVVMPELDGYEICKILKADDRTKKIPIIFITSKDSEEDERKGFEVGAVDYVMKPFRSAIVKARVNTHAELKKYRDFLESLSLMDGLTGIPNRRRFDEYLDTIWEFAVRESSPISLILIDIDYFKQFNDHYGHQAGDECLIQIAQKIRSTSKRKIDLVARYGGEEFACILPKTKLADAIMIAEKFRESVLSLQIPHAYSLVESFTTISLGVATILPIPRGTKTPFELVKAADEALYMSKEGGKNKVSSLEISSS